VLDWSDQVTIWDVLKGVMSLAEVGWWCGKHEPSICSTELNAMQLQHSRCVLNSSHLRAADPRTPGVYCTAYSLCPRTKLQVSLNTFLGGREGWGAGDGTLGLIHTRLYHWAKPWPVFCTF
jgi:hypothetical protein